MGEEQSLLLVRMIASELGYTVRWVQFPKGKVKDVVVLERMGEGFRSFVGTNKFDLALEWLRQKV